MLATFFNDTLKDPTDPRCDQFIRVFSKTDLSKLDKSQYNADGSSKDKTSPNKYGQSRFQSLWYNGPNKVNKAFIGMSQLVNSVKGKFFNADIVGFQKAALGTDKGSAYRNLNLWNDMYALYSLSLIYAKC